MNDEKSDDDIDAKMYAEYSCVDCDQEFDSRKELEDHEPNIKISQEQVDNNWYTKLYYYNAFRLEFQKVRDIVLGLDRYWALAFQSL